MAGVIPHAEAQERVDGTEDRLIGVVDALKYYDSGDGGFGFLRRHKSTKANAREFHVHFRSRDCEDFLSLEQGSEVEFTLVDNHGRANARDVVPTGTVIELPPKQERWSRDGARLSEARSSKPMELRRAPPPPAQAKSKTPSVTPDSSDAAPVSETTPESTDGSSENSERRAQLDRLATFGIGPAAPAPRRRRAARAAAAAASTRASTASTAPAAGQRIRLRPAGALLLAGSCWRG